MHSGGRDFPSYMELVERVLEKPRRHFYDGEDLNVLAGTPMATQRRIVQSLAFPFAHELAHIYNRRPSRRVNRDELLADCSATYQLLLYDSSFSLGVFQEFTKTAIEQGARSVWEGLEEANSETILRRIKRIESALTPFFLGNEASDDSACKSL